MLFLMEIEIQKTNRHEAKNKTNNIFQCYLSVRDSINEKIMKMMHDTETFCKKSMETNGTN